MKLRLLYYSIIGSIFSATVLFPSCAQGELVINSPVTDWDVVSFGNSYPDYFDDQQTGQEDSDIVGSEDVPAFYKAFDGGGTEDQTDGTLAFRIRISGSKKTYWNNYFWVGMDADLDGDIDLYVNLAKNNTIELRFPGNDLNISPNTTSIESPTALYTAVALENENYSFMKADDISAPGLVKDVDNYPNGSSKDGTDWFVSFSLSFADVVSMLASTNIEVDESTPMAFLAATSTQGNSLNQDINGAPKIDNTNKHVSWVKLGAESSLVSPNGDVVPEPAAMGLTLLGGIWMLVQSRLRNRSSESE